MCMKYFTEGLDTPKMVLHGRRVSSWSVSWSKCWSLLHKGAYFQAFGLHMFSVPCMFFPLLTSLFLYVTLSCNTHISQFNNFNISEEILPFSKEAFMPWCFLVLPLTGEHRVSMGVHLWAVVQNSEVMGSSSRRQSEYVLPPYSIPLRPLC